MQEPADFADNIGRFLTIGEVAREVGLSPATIHRRIKSGLFPRPVHLGTRTSRWVESEIYNWKLAICEGARL